MQTLIGCTVLTRYNNKTYRADDIMWDLSPKIGFELEDGRKTTFIDYYRDNYGKVINDHDQPLLMSRGKRRVSNDGSAQPVYLVPELCAMTGLTDALRENQRVMQDLAQHTRVSPATRIRHVRDYLNAMNAVCTFLTDPHNLSQWLTVFSKGTRAAAEELFKHIKALGQKSGMAVAEPQIFQTEDETVRSFLEGIKAVEQKDPELQIVVAVVPNDNKTRYDAIKKHCCLESGVPSQVVQARSLEKNTLSVASKILLQMNCKLGGSLWRANIPMKNTMIIGYDLYNDSSSMNKKVGAAVFSLNEQFTKWYSQCAFHGQSSELVANLMDFCLNGLKKYEKVNGRLPDRIILFRDGVGDGHIPVVYKDELPQVQKAFMSVGGPEYKPRFAFVIVTKRVHSRYFKCENNEIANPVPGTVVDDVIARPERYDFYLVPQCVRQGTVTPVSYNVIFDESGLSPTNMQKLAYKLCHMYYNWQGTIRVPAPCQLAHKLAFLVGQTLHKPAEEKLSDKLFFL